MSRQADQFLRPLSGKDLLRVHTNSRINDPAQCGFSSSPVADLVRAGHPQVT